jgi:hypothetical protein
MLEAADSAGNGITSMAGKTKRGKNIDKHCAVPECSSMGKPISGKNWYKHKAVHLKDGMKEADIKSIDCKNDETC